MKDVANWAAVVLLIESALLLVVVMAVLLLGTVGMGALGARVRPALSRARGAAERGERATRRVAGVVAAPLLWVSSGAVGVGAFLRALIRGPSRR